MKKVLILFMMFSFTIVYSQNKDKSSLIDALLIEIEARLGTEQIIGGWMQYGTKYVDEYGKTTKIEGVDFNLSQDAFDQIIKSVPRIDDKEQE